MQGYALFHCGQLETTAWLDARKSDALRESGCNGNSGEVGFASI